MQNAAGGSAHWHLRLATDVPDVTEPRRARAAWCA